MSPSLLLAPCWLPRETDRLCFLSDLTFNTRFGGPNLFSIMKHQNNAKNKYSPHQGDDTKEIFKGSKTSEVLISLLYNTLPPPATMKKRRRSLKQNQQLRVEVICPPSFSSAQLKARCQLFNNEPRGSGWPMSYSVRNEQRSSKGGVSREASEQDTTSAPNTLNTEGRSASEKLPSQSR